MDSNGLTDFLALETALAVVGAEVGAAAGWGMARWPRAKAVASVLQVALIHAPVTVEGNIASQFEAAASQLTRPTGRHNA